MNQSADHIASHPNTAVLQHVLVIEDEQGKRVVPLQSTTSTIGRDPSSSIVLFSTRISRQHAILLRTTTPGNSNHQFRIIDGNLQGKRSTNGLTINNIACISHDLHHGDRIVFGGEVSARYYTAIEQSDIEYLTSCETEDLSGFLSTLHNPFATLGDVSPEEKQARSEVAIARLASIPELFIHPILEINLTGEIIYQNPAATLQFPDLEILQSRHPIIEGITKRVASSPVHFFVQEISIKSKVYEQSIHSIAESDLIRIYLVDITERKKAEREVAESQILLQHAFDYAPIGMALVSLEGRWLKVNDALCSILGYTAPELLRMTFQEITSANYIKMVMAHARKLISGRVKTCQIEKIYIHKQGNEVWVQSSISLVRDQLGQPDYFIAQIQDISDRKHSETALQKTTILQTAILESTSHAVISTGIDGKITTFNVAAEKMLGYRASDVINRKTPLIFYHEPEVIERLHTEFDSFQSPVESTINSFIYTLCKATSEYKEWTYCRKDQSQFPVELSFTTLQNSKKNITGFLITAQDITQRQQDEKALKQAHDDLEIKVKERTLDLQIINQKLKDEIIDRINAEEEVYFLQQITQKISESQDLSTALQIALKLICTTTGWDFGEAWIPSQLGDCLEYGAAWHRDDADLKVLYLNSQTMTFAPGIGLPGRVWHSQQPEWIYEISSQSESVMLRRDLTSQAKLSTGFGIPVIEGRHVIAVLIFFMRNLSGDQMRQVQLVSTVALQLGALIQRKKAEGALRSNLAHYQALLQALPDHKFQISLEGTIIHHKAAKDSILPLLSEEFIGKNLEALLPTEAAQQFMTAIAQVQSSKNLEVVEYCLNLNNKLYEFEARFSLSEEEEEIITIIRDITERKEAVAKIYEALKREKELNELKTRFVSITSHEFRTPLATILASAELLEHYRHKWSPEKVMAHLLKIQTSSLHMTELLNDVLFIGTADSGNLKFKPSEVNIIDFCRNLVEEVQLSTQTHYIHFKTNKDQEFFLIDLKLFRQILCNLLSNSIKYSPQSKDIYFWINCEEESIEIQIKDEGIGISSSEISKIFHPFERANNVGNISGTGLGLPIVKKAIELHAGSISVESELNQGSTFRISLPLATK